MHRCALLSMNNLDAFECYDHLLFEPLAELGWQAQEVPWRDQTIDWNQFDVVIIRSPWDYQDDPELFINVLETIDQSSAHLENSFEIVQWNLDKRYLKEIQSKGIPIVPTLWRDDLSNSNISSFFDDFNSDELIIKPVISANADDTYRIDSSINSATKSQIARVFSDRPLMVQPFMEEIITEGEFSLFYFGGTYSHTILKTPEQGDFRVQEEHGGTLANIEPEPALKALGLKTMQALPQPPLYARVDFVRTSDNNFALMELELIEPSLYFNMDPQSPQRFAGEFDKWMQTRI